MLVKDAMHPRGLTIEPHATLPEAVVKMQELQVKRLPVVLDGQLVGLLTDGEIKRNLPALSEGLTPWEFAGQAGRLRVRDVMRTPVHTLRPEETLEHAIHTFLNHRIGGMPVLDEDGHLVGMLTLTDILRVEQAAPRLRWGAVDQHMTSEVVSVGRHDLLSDAAAKLRVSRLRVLPVMDDARLVGVLHEIEVSAAFERAVAAHGDTLSKSQFFLQDKKVSDLMRPPSGYIQTGTPMRDALKKMLELDVHGLPVIDGEGCLTGVVTISDVLKSLVGQSK